MARSKLTDDDIRNQLSAAKARSASALKHRVRAREARVDRKRRVLTVVLTNGSAFSVSLEKVPDLAHAATADLCNPSIDSIGMGLHWEHLDVDLSVAGLARLVFGELNLLAAAGSAGGSVTSTAKSVAARRNGLKGGRPRKSVIPVVPTGPHITSISGAIGTSKSNQKPKALARTRK